MRVFMRSLTLRRCKCAQSAWLVDSPKCSLSISIATNPPKMAQFLHSLLWTMQEAYLKHTDTLWRQKVPNIQEENFNLEYVNKSSKAISTFYISDCNIHKIIWHAALCELVQVMDSWWGSALNILHTELWDVWEWGCNFDWNV